jgi:mono/diheme cytochrome c family protein
MALAPVGAEARSRLGIFMNWGQNSEEPLMKTFIAALGVLGLLAGAASAQDATLGKKLYVDNCLRCHGAKGQGGVGKKLVGDAAYWDFDIFKRTVVTGIDDEGKKMKTMPVFGTVGFTKPKGVKPTDPDLMNIQAYLKTFGPAE